ncbi:uncharacterized protein [Phyllobates terribilis]|uniref:uncharacterized protein n=1 Tax=Phyllobates terribilis TaxID=111132 RepID=UPI003CCB4254
MHVVPALLLFWGWLPSSGAACTTAYGGKIHYCKTFQTDYIEGMEILIFEERDVGRINSTVLSSPNLKSVLSLTLKGSKIRTIESGAFQQFKGLGILELQNNSLTTLSPSWFHDPGTLKNLTMANNSIGQLHPEMLDGFSNLEWLNLSLNQITSIHIESFRSLSKMVSLDLSYNKISSLRWQTLSPLNGTLRLGGNPWNCSCAHKDFILFLKELLNASRLTDPTSVTCRYPPDLMGALVWNLTEMNCSLLAPPPLPETGFHKVVLPVLFVVLGGLFFSISMWLIVCILTSRCKNKVTNVTDPERPLRPSSENCAHTSHRHKGSVVSHIRQDRLIGSAHLRHEITEGSAMQTECPENLNEKGRDLERFLHSDMKTSKSEPLVFPLGVSAPVLDAFIFGEMVFSTEHVTSQTSAYKQDPTSPKNTVTVQNLEAARFHPAGKLYSENKGGLCGNPIDNVTGETGLVTYFETDIDSVENTKNASSTRKSQTEGAEPSPEHLVSSGNGNPSTFAKKCKTWSTFCRDDELIVNPAECPRVPRTEINPSVGKGEEIAETSGSNLEEEGNSEPRGRNLTDVGPGNYDIGDEGHKLKDVTTWQILQESKDHRTESRIEEGPYRRQHQGPSKKTTTRPKEIRSSLAHEKFWKYHKNCCDEFNPCQTASKVLKISEKREQRTEELKQEPPSDDELLEEIPSLPLLLSIPSESKPLTNPALSSRKTCISLPNLGVYDNHNSSVICAHFTEPVLVQDETGNKKISKVVSVLNTELPVIELPAEDIVSQKRLAEGSPSKTKLPFVDVLSEGLIKAESGLYDVSGTSGPTSGNNAKVTNSLEQDVQSRKPDLRVLNGQAQDFLSYDSNCQNINAPPRVMLREDDLSQGVVPTSNLEVPAINLQTESPLRNEIRYTLHLPTIDVPSGDNTIGRISLQDDLPEKLDIPIVVDRMEKFNDISLDVRIFHNDWLPKIVGLPTTEVQSEALAINESNPSDILQSHLGLFAISEPPEDKRFDESKTVKPGKQKGKRYVKAKSCPVLSAKPNIETEHRNPNGVKFKSDQGSKTIDLRNNMIAPSASTTIKASQETMNTGSQESPMSSKEQELGPDLNLSSETQLTPSDSYPHSFEDGDEISEWPKSADLLKRSSTISLSSKYDILESSPLLPCKDDNEYPTIVDNGHNVVNSDFCTCGMENSGYTNVLNDHKAEDGNSKVSSPEECTGDKYMIEDTLHTCNTLEETSERNSKLPSEKEMTDGPRPPQRSSLDAEVMDNQTTEHTNLMQVLTRKNSEGSSHTSSVQDVSHQFSLAFNGQREDLDEHEDPSDNVTSSIVTQDQTTQPKVPRSNDKETKNQQKVFETGRDQVIQHVKLENTLTEHSTNDLGMSYFINEENRPIDVDESGSLSESDCKSADALTYGRQKVKNRQEDDYGGIEETHIFDLKKQSSLQSRSKDLTSKIRKTIGGQKRVTNKTSKTENIIAPCVQDDHKDYISTRLLRRSFQTIFPVSVKTPCPQVGDKLNALSLREQPFDPEIINPPRDLLDTLNQNNFTSTHFEEPSKRMTDAIEYLTSLYARNPRLKVSQDSYDVPGKDDKTIEDIRVLAKLQFCKVSGGFIVDAQKTETPYIIEEPTKDPILSTSKSDDPYIPPSKDELKADDELAVLNIMYTIKKSLELSTTYDTDDVTDT